MQYAGTCLANRLFSFFTGLVFLNMSLVMAELCALKLDRDKDLMENIARITGGCSEEEADSMGDEDTTVKEINLMIGLSPTVPLRHLLDSSHIKVQNEGMPSFGNYEIYSPPPQS